MPESGTSGSVGAAGEQSPVVTRPLFGALPTISARLQQLEYEGMPIMSRGRTCKWPKDFGRSESACIRTQSSSILSA
jgi:hypothetical protein